MCWCGELEFLIILFSEPVQIWFSLIAELLVDAALLFFGFRLARSLKRVDNELDVRRTLEVHHTSFRF